MYLGCVCLGQAEEEAVEAWNRTEGIDKVTILESERDGAPEMDSESETTKVTCGEREQQCK